MFYRISYKNTGIYQALKYAVPFQAWRKILKNENISWLPKPPEYIGEFNSYFTQKGFYMFYEKVLPICMEYLQPEIICIEYVPVLPSEHVYEDEYQVIVRKFSKFNTAYAEAMKNRNYDFPEQIISMLKQLNMFRYGCLYNFGKFITDLSEIDRLDGTDIIVQNSREFLERHAGMCHDASVAVDELLKNNFIVYKCFFMISGDPNGPTHSFITAMTEQLEWKIIDVFSDGFENMKFNSYSSAADFRIDRWIKNKNKGSADLEIFIGKQMPSGNISLPEFINRIKSSFSEYFTDTQMKQTYFYDKRMLSQQSQILFKKYSNKFNEFNIGENIIIETTYFNDVPQQLEDYFINEIDRNLSRKNYFIQIPVSEIAKILLNGKIKNYMNFHEFLKRLSQNETGFIDVKFTEIDSYFQPPVQISKIRIENDRNRKTVRINEMELITHDYEKFIAAKTENDKNMEKIYRTLNNQAVYREEWGQIGINARFFTSLRNHLPSVIDHQLGHFISFLIRISGINHNLCRNWSNNIHAQFSPDNSESNCFLAYLLDSDEFKRWSDTVIQRLCRSFQFNSLDFSKENKLDFYNYVLYACDAIKDYKVKNKANMEILNRMFSRDSAVSFIKTIYQDSLKKSGRNNFTIFKKFFLHQLMNTENKDSQI